MEKSRILLVTLLSLGLCMQARAQEGALVRFTAPELTVDTVRFDSGAHTLRYPFENVSGKPVTVLEVHSNCGCFTGQVNRRVLTPGQKAVLTAVLDPKSLYGPVDRSLTIVTTDGKETILSSVTVKGYVLRDQSEGEIRFAEDLGHGLRTDASEYLLSRDSFGDYVFSIPLYNDTDRPVTLEVEASGRRLKLYAPETIAPHSRENLRGVYDARRKWLGKNVKETIRIRVDGVETAPLLIRGTIQ